MRFKGYKEFNKYMLRQTFLAACFMIASSFCSNGYAVLGCVFLYWGCIFNMSAVLRSQGGKTW